MYIDPTTSDFRQRFDRDFPFGPDDSLLTVRDKDVQLGLDTAALRINPAFFQTQASYSALFLLLAAHYLVMNLRASSQGIAGKYPWLDSSTGAGGVSRAAMIPARILDAPAFAGYSATRYGADYLLQLMPYVSGRVGTVRGRTLP